MAAPGLGEPPLQNLVGAFEEHQPDVEIRALDAELDNTWGVKQINAGLVHDSGNKGAAVKVCLLDRIWSH